VVRYEAVLLLPHGTSKELAVRAKVSATAHAIQLVPTWMPLWALSSFVFLCIYCCSAVLSYLPALTCWKCPKDQLLSWVFQKKKSRLGMANQIEMMFGSRLLAIHAFFMHRFCSVWTSIFYPFGFGLKDVAGCIHVERDAPFGSCCGTLWYVASFLDMLSQAAPAQIDA